MDASATQPPAGTLISVAADDGFQNWMSRFPGSLLISTYQAGKVAVVSWDGQQVNLLLRNFDKPMGMAARGNSLLLATRHEVTVLTNAPLLAADFNPAEHGRYDSLFLPRATYHTGDLNVHDLAYTRDGIVVVATRFSCLGTLSFEHCFHPGWRPSFVSETAPEDRCHLNGLATVDGTPKFVTALGETDTPGGWRANKATAGVLLEVPTGNRLLAQLSMPHSPQWHNAAVWFLNSGTGELCRYNPGDSQYDVVCALPAYLRGLWLTGPYAVVGMCQIREKHIFGGLPVQQRHHTLECGVAVVELATGRIVGKFQFTAGCTEVYGVLGLPGFRRPMLLNTQHPAAKQAFPAPEFSYWLRPENEIFEAK